MKQQDLVVGPLAEPASIPNKPVQDGDRRKEVRFSVSASAEMLELSTSTRLAGRASDLGAGGCYVDTMTPFPVGSSLVLSLSSENHNVHVKANVVYSRTGMGMGLTFTEITAKQKENLAAWLRELNGGPAQARASEMSTFEATMPYVREVAEETVAHAEEKGLLAAFEELISLLRVKRILSDSEIEILREKISK